MLSLGQQQFGHSFLPFSSFDIFERGVAPLSFSPELFHGREVSDMGPRMSVISQQMEGNYYVVKVATPGVRREDLTISVDNSTRFITVSVQVQNSVDGYTSQSSAQTSVYVPSFAQNENGEPMRIDINDLQGIAYKDGVLVARIPIREGFEPPTRRLLPIRLG